MGGEIIRVMDDEFFILDSNNIQNAKNRIYGYLICSRGIITQDNLELFDIEKDVSEDGAFILVRSDGKEVVITQDYFGSWGIYYYSNKDYFALSNSFLLLAEYLSKNHQLTLNKDYLSSYINVDLSSYSVYDTPIDEIKLLDRWAVVKWNLKNKRLHIKINNHNEGTIPLNSKEGIDVLDEWYLKWTNIIGNLHEHTHIDADLSGGLDTRMTLTLLLSPQIELNKINIHSNISNLHTFNEDYLIASEIAKTYSFDLNGMEINDDGTTYTTESINHHYQLIKSGFHKIPLLPKKCYTRNKFTLTGEGGECIRGYWKDKDSTSFLRIQLSRYRDLSIISKSELYPNIVNFINKQIDDIRTKYQLLNHNICESNLINILYKESRARHHFGKVHVERFLANQISLAPLMDPLINKLDSDVNELPTLIFTRFGPDLCNIKIEGRRELGKENLNKAKLLNETYPLRLCNQNPCDYLLPSVNFSNENHDYNGDYNKFILSKITEMECLIRYCANFPKESYYNCLLNNMKYENNFPIQYITPIYSIAEVSKYANTKKELFDNNNVQVNVMYNLLCRERYYEIVKNYSNCVNTIFQKIILATAYSKINVKKYSGKIYDYLIEAYEYGIVEALYQLYDIMYSQTDCYSSIHLRIICKKLQSIPEMDSYVRLAKSYRFGKGNGVNLKEAIRYYEKAYKLHPEWIKKEYCEALLEDHSDESIKKLTLL